MKIVISVLLLTMLLSFSACGESPVMPSTSTVVQEKPAETRSLAPTSTAEKPGRLVVTPAVNQVSTETPVLVSSANPKPVIKTTIGDLVIEKVRSVNEVNGESAGPNEKLILVVLGKIGVAKLDQSNFSLDAFDKAMRTQSSGEVHISGDDGSYAVCSMAGWIQPDYTIFAMGFRVPDSAKTYQLIWPGNDPVNLVLNE